MLQKTSVMQDPPNTPMSKYMPPFEPTAYADWYEDDGTQIYEYLMIDMTMLKTLWEYPRSTEHEYVGMRRNATGQLVLQYRLKFGNNRVFIECTTNQ